MKTVIAAAALTLTLSTAHANTIIAGKVCDNTCFGYMPGDNTPDYLGLLGPVFGELLGPFKIDFGATTTSLTIGGHSFSFANNDPHYSVSFNPPEFPGAYRFEASGVTNIFGIAAPETIYDCPPFTVGVPEPSTWAMFLIGFAGIGYMLSRRRPPGRFTVRVL